VLHDINEFAERRSSRGGVVRFLTNRTDASEIADYREMLKQAMGDFLVGLNSPLQSDTSLMLYRWIQVKSQIYTHIYQHHINQMNTHKSEQLYNYLHTCLHIYFITPQVSLNNEKLLRKKLNPVQRGTKEGCMAGTRQDILARIFEWVEDTDQPNILWLSGSPGAGKSAIASTVVSQLLDKNSKHQHLSSAFWFKRGDALLGDPASLWRTIAFGLACHDPAIKQNVVDTLEQQDLETAGVEDHFKHLIESSLSKCPPSQFVVIVLDALDECGSSASRKHLLHTLQRWAQLSKNCKLLVTSRAESDIKRCFATGAQHIELKTGTLVNKETSEDVSKFLTSEFARIADVYGSLPPNWPGEAVVKKLTDKAAGLFIWATTVTRFMEDGIPTEQLSMILDGGPEMGDIDVLYITILNNAFKGHCVQFAKAILGTIVLAKIPLNEHDLQKLLGESSETIEFVLQKVQPIITRDSSCGIRIAHQLFADFLCDLKRSGPFYINPQTLNQRIGLSCLQIMNSGLTFNIFKLETSHLPNDKVADLDKRIQENIPACLIYACQFWADHLNDGLKEHPNTELIKGVQHLLYIHLLHWLEVLSVVRALPIAPHALKAAYELVKVSLNIQYRLESALNECELS